MMHEEEGEGSPCAEKARATGLKTRGEGRWKTADSLLKNY